MPQVVSRTQLSFIPEIWRIYKTGFGVWREAGKVSGMMLVSAARLFRLRNWPVRWRRDSRKREKGSRVLTTRNSRTFAFHIVAHATRNPLNSIGLTVSYLKKTLPEDLASEFLSIIKEEVKRIDRITNIFLDFSSSSPLAIQACNVGSLVHASRCGSFAKQGLVGGHHGDRLRRPITAHDQ